MALVGVAGAISLTVRSLGVYNFTMALVIRTVTDQPPCAPFLLL
jgi:hypothetical protein